MHVVALSDLQLHRVQKIGQKIPQQVIHVIVLACIAALAGCAFQGNVPITTLGISVIALSLADVSVDMLCGQAKKKSRFLYTMLSVCIVALAICGLTDAISSQVMGYSIIGSMIATMVLLFFYKKEKKMNSLYKWILVTLPILFCVTS